MMPDTKIPVSSHNAATNLTPGSIAIPTDANQVEIRTTTVDAFVSVIGTPPTAANGVRVIAGLAEPEKFGLSRERISPRTLAGLTGGAAVRAQTTIYYVGQAAGPGTININFYKS